VDAPRFEPFAPDRCRALAHALDGAAPGSLEAFAALRAKVSGLDAPLVGLESLLESEPDWAPTFFDRVVPALCEAAWALVATGTPSLPLLTAMQRGQVAVPRAVVPGWIAHMLLGTLPTRERRWPVVDGTLLLARTRPQEVAKLRCILTLFERTADAPLPGRLTIARRVTAPRNVEAWAHDPSPLTDLVVEATGTIEDAEGHLQADFANKYLGGGVLTGGCVQEEIRFAVSPELLAAMLVAPVMEPREAVAIHGAERFARYDGYGFSLRYAGPYDDPAPRLPDGTPDVTVVAMDALDFRSGYRLAQYDDDKLLRELEKARAAFLPDPRAQPIATGNWGAGVFLGDAALKAILQWIAASACHRAVRYYAFGDGRIEGLADFADAARTKFGTAGALWSALRRALAQPRAPDDETTLFARVLAA
jgi:poly(ADP-ribose) glycohydrolase